MLQMKFIEHLTRKDEIERIYGKIVGQRGRQKNECEKHKEIGWTRNNILSNTYLAKLPDWIVMITDACSRPGS